MKRLDLGKYKRAEKRVTITDDSEVICFDSKKDCANFLQTVCDYTKNSLLQFLGSRREVIAGWKIFYE